MQFNISNFVNDVFTNILQIRLWHFQTPKGFHHQALGDFYDSFTDLSDKLIEVYMGRYGRFELDDEDLSVNIMNFESTDASQWIYDFTNFFNMHKSDLEMDGEEELMAIMDEIKNEFGRLSYKLLLEKADKKR